MYDKQYEQYEIRILIVVAEFCEKSLEVRMTSLRVLTCARDQSLESTQSDWSIKFSKLFWRVVDKHRETFAAKFLRRPLQVTSTRLKKLELCCDLKRKKLVVQTCCP